MDKHPTARYPNETVDEFEKNVVHKHHDNVTQWVNEFSKKRGWFVQVGNWNTSMSVFFNWPPLFGTEIKIDLLQPGLLF